MVLCRVIGFLVAKERNEFLMLSFVKATKERSTNKPADMMHHSGSTEFYKHLYLDYRKDHPNPRRPHKQHPDL
uniref:Uncharacterized protein n=1 Tax=Brassica oleracea TaxID=3712 RepID=A0A3P6FTP5_BRAOL|nr:unnamed protein product [Brassica oleracea]